MRKIIVLDEATRMDKELLSGRLDPAKATRQEVLAAGANKVGREAGKYVPYGQKKVAVNRVYTAQGKVMSDMASGKTTDQEKLTKIAGGSKEKAEIGADHAKNTAKHVLHGKETPRFVR